MDDCALFASRISRRVHPIRRLSFRTAFVILAKKIAILFFLFAIFISVVCCSEFTHGLPSPVQMSAKAVVSIDVDAKSGGGAWGRISRELTSALEEPLLRPLIDIVFQYARSTADWSRATVETVRLALYPINGSGQPCAVAVDSERRRVLWSDFNANSVGSVVAVSFDDLKAAPVMPPAGEKLSSGQAPAPPALPTDQVKRVAGRIKSRDSPPTIADCVQAPASIAIEPTTGALWIADEQLNRVVRVDERTGAIVSFGDPKGSLPGLVNGPARDARFSFPAYVVWDAARKRALVSDASNHCIRAITRIGAGTDVDAWTVSTLIGGAEGKEGTDDGNLKTARLSRPIAMAFDLWRPHILYISGKGQCLRIADFENGTHMRARAHFRTRSLTACPPSCAALSDCAETVRTVAFKCPPERSPQESYGMMMDPLSTEAAPQLLLTCWNDHALYRLSLKDATLTIVLGGAPRGGGQSVDGGAATAAFTAPNGLALAPQELLRDSDGLAIILCDMTAGWIRIVRVPH
jgi:hypothetical protein